MSRYIAKRLIQAVIVVILIAIFSYFLMYFVPGDPVYATLGSDITREQYEMQYYKLELDKPVYVRFLHWAGKALRLDFGDSYRYNIPVSRLMNQRLPVTMYLGVWSIIVSTLIGIILGVLCGTHRGQFLDSLLITCANFGAVMPPFWLARCHCRLRTLQSRRWNTLIAEWLRCLHRHLAFLLAGACSVPTMMSTPHSTSFPTDLSLVKTSARPHPINTPEGNKETYTRW